VLSAELISEIIGDMLKEVYDLYGEDALVYYRDGFFSAIQLMNAIQEKNEEQRSFQESLKIAEAFHAYKNKNGGIN
jgi:hypothetical protein